MVTFFRAGGSMVEYLHGMEGVEGSSPFRSTKKSQKTFSCSTSLSFSDCNCFFQRRRSGLKQGDTHSFRRKFFFNRKWMPFNRGNSCFFIHLLSYSFCSFWKAGLSLCF